MKNNATTKTVALSCITTTGRRRTTNLKKERKGPSELLREIRNQKLRTKEETEQLIS